MSEIALKSKTRQSSPLRPLFDWLQQARVALSLPEPISGNLPDEFMRDIGVEHREIMRAVDDGTARLGLLDIGWQPPRRPSRR